MLVISFENVFFFKWNRNVRERSGFGDVRRQRLPGGGARHRRHGARQRPQRRRTRRRQLRHALGRRQGAPLRRRLGHRAQSVPSRRIDRVFTALWVTLSPLGNLLHVSSSGHFSVALNPRREG